MPNAPHHVEIELFAFAVGVPVQVETRPVSPAYKSFGEVVVVTTTLIEVTMTTAVWRVTRNCDPRSHKNSITTPDTSTTMVALKWINLTFGYPGIFCLGWCLLTRIVSVHFFSHLVFSSSACRHGIIATNDCFFDQWWVFIWYIGWSGKHVRVDGIVARRWRSKRGRLWWNSFAKRHFEGFSKSRFFLWAPLNSSNE